MERMGQHDMGLRERDADLEAEIRKIGRYRWVVYGIAALAAADVLTTWAGLGSLTGFPVWHLGRLRIDTSWTLPFIMEGYAGFALQVWLTVGPGRTRRYAMTSALALLALSLVGQIAYHLMLVHHDRYAGAFLVGFAACLPVASLLCGAILMHLLQLDGEALRAQLERRREAERRAAIERAEADERAALRRQVADLTARRAAEVSALEGRLGDMASALESDRQDLARAIGRAEALERKLAAAALPQARKAAAPGANAQDSDPTNDLRAVMELRDNPRLLGSRMGGELARALNIGASTGRRLHGKLVKDGALTDYARSLIESPAEQSG